MDINVKTIKFDATDKLQEFIQKKVSKLDKFCDYIRKVEVSLKVVKSTECRNIGVFSKEKRLIFATESLQN